MAQSVVKSLTQTLINNNLKTIPLRCISSTTIRPKNKTRDLDLIEHSIASLKEAPVTNLDLGKIVINVPLDTAATTGVPDEHIDDRHVRIFMPARTASQSGTNQTHRWKIEFENRERWENNLMGWASNADPFSNISMAMDFPDAESAVAFCEKNGWQYHVEEARTKLIRQKSYGANFSWNSRTRRSAK